MIGDDSASRYDEDARTFAVTCGFARDGSVAQNLQALIRRIRSETVEACARDCSREVSEVFKHSYEQRLMAESLADHFRRLAKEIAASPLHGEGVARVDAQSKGEK